MLKTILFFLGEADFVFFCDKVLSIPIIKSFNLQEEGEGGYIICL